MKSNVNHGNKPPWIRDDWPWWVAQRLEGSFSEARSPMTPTMLWRRKETIKVGEERPSNPAKTSSSNPSRFSSQKPHKRCRKNRANRLFKAQNGVCHVPPRDRVGFHMVAWPAEFPRGRVGFSRGRVNSNFCYSTICTVIRLQYFVNSVCYYSILRWRSRNTSLEAT